MKHVTTEEARENLEWLQRTFKEPPTENCGWWWSLYRMASEVIRLKRDGIDAAYRIQELEKENKRYKRELKEIANHGDVLSGKTCAGSARLAPQASGVDV